MPRRSARLAGVPPGGTEPTPDPPSVVAPPTRRRPTGKSTKAVSTASTPAKAVVIPKTEPKTTPKSATSKATTSTTRSRTAKRKRSTTPESSTDTSVLSSPSKPLAKKVKGELAIEIPDTDAIDPDTDTIVPDTDTIDPDTDDLDPISSAPETTPTWESLSSRFLAEPTEPAELNIHTCNDFYYWANSHRLDPAVLKRVQLFRIMGNKRFQPRGDRTEPFTGEELAELNKWQMLVERGDNNFKPISLFNSIMIQTSKSKVRWKDLDVLDKASMWTITTRNPYWFTASTRDDNNSKELFSFHPHLLHFWTDIKADPPIEPVAISQPESINRKLKSFQLEGVDWMIRQEKTKYKGGLLGDEMGMGKTIQAVSLIMSDYPAPEPTLVLVPPVALMQWSNEMREYTDGKLKMLIIHGSNTKTKGLQPDTIRQYDVILVSYNTLESTYRKQTKGWNRGENIAKEDSAIHAVHWHRIILDEAHSIKQRTTGVAKACFALQGTYRWCLSGTPVQNRVGEFFSLLRFLQVRPVSDYMCRKCKCSIMHWEVDANRMCTSCGHAGSSHISYFNYELLNPLTSGVKKRRDLALAKLHAITSRVMLRRLKQDHMSSMELPPKSVVVNRQFFGDVEKDFSQSIMSNTARQFDTYVSRGVMLNNYANIFGLIMQMRQVANHPDLILRRHAEGGQNVIVCCICNEPAEEAVRSSCKHHFCRSCVRSYIQNSTHIGGGVAECPQCHIVLSIDWEQAPIEQDELDYGTNSIINRIKMDTWTSSTKIEQLIYELYKLRSKKQTLKSIVFSQFTSMLQLIQWRLHRAGFKTVMLDGSMNPAQRQRSIDYFMSNPDVEVFLVSLKAGGVALNLTEASRVFIVDPWWNPAAEWQSADRCHRIGQRRPCQITRLCIEDSVESRIVLLQEKKAKMIRCTVNNDSEAIGSLRPEDLQFLFRGD